MKNYLKISILIILWYAAGFNICWSQETPDTSNFPIINIADTTAVAADSIKPHSVRRATILSTSFPGLGQAYNKKWWKMPLIYGALGGVGYLIVTNHIQHKAHVNEYINRQGNPNYVIPSEFSNLDDEGLITVHRQFQNSRDLMIIAFIAVYAVNIIDAAVDAHFYDFDISDDLSLHIRPSMYWQHPTLQVSLGFHQNTSKKKINFKDF